MWKPRQSSLKQQKGTVSRGRGGRETCRGENPAIGREMPAVGATVNEAPLGQLRRQGLGWQVPQALAGSVTPEAHLASLLSHSPARRSQRPEEAPSLIETCRSSVSTTLLPPGSRSQIPQTWSPMPSWQRGGSCSSEREGDLPSITKLAGGSVSPRAPSPHTPDSQASCHICSPAGPWRGGPDRQWDPCGLCYLKQKEGFHTWASIPAFRVEKEGLGACLALGDHALEGDTGETSLR